ncbi:Glycosyltransferase like family [Rhizoctonia solani]|uniref:Glycosyltransferase like family n=1 Tax=Rhizoctonia solani TaxID=456999 RepID=A0A8H7HG55_9AGAM|nr:Glycosyltransferase like family [Rhizoctonia solani]
MSFADLERGQGGFQSSSALVPTSPSDAEFLGLQKSLSVQIFKINSNVQGILKLVDQLGTARDTGTVRKGLHELTETTRELIKRGTDDLKTLSTLQRNLPQHKALLQKTSHDFQVSLVAFQRAQKVSAERQRTVVDGVKQAVEDNANSSGAVASSPQSQRQIQAFQSQISPAELAHQESLIQDREAEIREIETGIHELNEIFRDLGTLVTEQGTMLDTIETNVDSVALDTRDAAQQLEQASEYQRKAGRRAACLMLVVVIVICVVLVAVRIVILSLEFPWFSTRVRLVDVSQINDN